MTPAEAIELLEKGDHLWHHERSAIALVIVNLVYQNKYKSEVIEQRNRMLERAEKEKN